jgi:mannosyltransferase OCH1-like enzyme
MIPKKIHYCWFGRNPLPESAQKCIASWRKFLPDYEIIEWNEDNYDVNKIAYTAEAYAVKKYAYVSDYARFDILYQYGGLYFDTDVEVIKPFDDIVANGPFMGCEFDSSKDTDIMVNPGLGLGAEAGLEIFRAVLDYYASRHYAINEQIVENVTVVTNTTNVLLKFGLKNEPGIQKIAGVTIYPRCYFNPLDDATGRLTVTPETHSIHWFSKTWCDMSPMRIRLARLSHRVFGTKLPALILKIFRLRK